MDVIETGELFGKIMYLEHLQKGSEKEKIFNEHSSYIIEPLQGKYRGNQNYRRWAIHPVPNDLGRTMITRFQSYDKSLDLAISYDSFNNSGEFYFGRRIGNFERSLLVICNIMPEIIADVKNNGFRFISDGKSQFSINNGGIGFKGKLHFSPENSKRTGQLILSVDDCVDKYLKETKIPKKLLEKLNH